MKRYLLFIGDTYYARGGWRDFEESFDTLPEAELHADESHADWWQIIDTTTWKIVSEQGEAFTP